MGREHYERAFSVFDRNGHHNFDQAVNRVTSSQRGLNGTWHAITSNPCFELWLLLHFQYSTAPIVKTGSNSACNMAIRALEQYLPGYSKGSKGVYDQVGHMTDVALANAEKLLRYNAQSDSLNPATNVHLLVDYLRKLK